ncbi:MAG TPA: hypothetical protein VI362_08790 [Ignavibacteriaceae bacterium]|nr:hypothetical protein [Ignavibacteriaceae bacterium]
MIKYILILAFIILAQIQIYSQVENVPLNHPVYYFLKEMKVKRVVSYIKEDIPNLSRFEVKGFLDEIESKQEQLSRTELKLLFRYKFEFNESLHPDTTTYFFHPEKDFGTSLSDVFSDKVKYLYAYREQSANIFFEGLGHFYFGQTFKPESNNSTLYDIGFRIRGTVFNHLGYNLEVIKGGSSGNREVAELIKPEVLTSYKWLENLENINNYDFTSGYIKYHTEPADEMDISFQLGREQKTVGYGYGSKLVLSGDNPPLDFLQFNFDYGMVHFTSIFASTVGEFSSNPDTRYTKYWAFNRLKLSFKNLIDAGIGESIVYSGRGIELGYATPLGFYKFIEHSLQDRDNANLYLDFQTNFIDNLEFQGILFLDENILSNLQDLDKYTNKTAYQLGFFWYQPLSLDDFSLVVEYTKIRPFVYSHVDSMNTYTAFGKNLGHRSGPNSDEIFSRLSYNFNEWIRINFKYAFVRSGENVYDVDGNLVKNVGGDIYLNHDSRPENDKAYFLDGVRINNNIFEIGLRIEPVRDFIFDIIYNYNVENNLTTGEKINKSYGYIRFSLEY